MPCMQIDPTPFGIEPCVACTPARGSGESHTVHARENAETIGGRARCATRWRHPHRRSPKTRARRAAGPRGPPGRRGPRIAKARRTPREGCEMRRRVVPHGADPRTPLVSDVTFAFANADAIVQGLIGFVRFSLLGVYRVDGVTLRLKRGAKPDAEFTLSFPERPDAAGRRHSLFRPVNDASRVALETAILAQLRDRMPLILERIARARFAAAGRRRDATQCPFAVQQSPTDDKISETHS